MRIVEYLAEAVVEQAEIFQDLWKCLHDEARPDAPHRQRTMVNRLSGYIRFTRLRESRPGVGRSIDVLRQWQKTLGPVRDLDVMRGWLDRCRAVVGEPASAAAAEMDIDLARRRAEQAAIVRRAAAGPSGARTRIALEEILQAFDERFRQLSGGRDALDPATALHDVIRPWIRHRDRLFHQHDAETLHAFRVRNKWLRFVLEVLAEAEEEPARRTLFADRATRCEEIHTVLGNLNDLKVLHNRLRLARAGWAERGIPLQESAAFLERGRVILVEEEEMRWYALWPELARPGFIRPLTHLGDDQDSE